MKERLIIIGAGGNGKVLADIASLMGKWEKICFVDDNTVEKDIMGYPVIGTIKSIDSYKESSDFFVGIGNNRVRETIFLQLEQEGLSIATLIHPKSIIGSNVLIGKGTAVMAGAIINPSTVIEEGVILNTGSTVDHDCMIGDFVHVSPGVNIAGTVKIKYRTWIGIGSAIVNNVSICEDVIIGANSLVIKDIKKTGTYIGSPVKHLL